MIKNNNKGFTLIELLVVVLILGILAAMAMPQYFKAVERSRMTEAVTLLANIAQSQQRKYMQINNYTENFRSLDVAPKDATGTSYCTKGTQPTTGETAYVDAAVSNQKCGDGNGFIVVMKGKALNDGKARATRSGANDLQYAYSLERFYGGQGTLCTAAADNVNGQELCADYCGLDAYTTGGCCSDGSTGASGECQKPGDADNKSTTD